MMILKKVIKRQSKLTFNGIHKSYENYDSLYIRKERSSYG